MRGRNWSNGLFVRTALPTFGFVIFGWLGLSQLMESKIRIKVGTHARRMQPHVRLPRQECPTAPTTHCGRGNRFPYRKSQLLGTDAHVDGYGPAEPALACPPPSCPPHA